jgi:hypothetical protein
MSRASLVSFNCDWCGSLTAKPAGHVNRSRREGHGLCCDRRCAGRARRDTRTPEQRKSDKSAYDRQYRERNRAELKTKKAAYYKATRDPKREREIRMKRMPLHVEYCRRPEYRAKKHQYDIERVSSHYGEFAEAHRLLIELERVIRGKLPDKYERLRLRGYYERQNEKRREQRARRVEQ